MGFLPNIFKIPKADIIPNIVTLGGYGLTKGTVLAAVSVVKSSVRSLAASGLSHERAAQQSPFNELGQPGNQYQYPPNYQQPYFDNQLMYGGSPWDSSMTSGGFSGLGVGTRSPVYSPQDSMRLDWGQGPFNL